jgi:hypothetical protein
MMHQKLTYANYNMIQQSKLLNTNIIKQFGTLTLKTLLSILEPKYLQQIATEMLKHNNFTNIYVQVIGSQPSKHSQEMFLEFPMKSSRKTGIPHANVK